MQLPRARWRTLAPPESLGAAKVTRTTSDPSPNPTVKATALLPLCEAGSPQDPLIFFPSGAHNIAGNFIALNWQSLIAYYSPSLQQQQILKKELSQKD